MAVNTKPFYRRWWFRAPCVLMVLVVFGAADNFGDLSSAAPSSGPHSSFAAAPALRTDKGWFLVSTRFPDHGIGDGDFGGTARITNTTMTSASGIFTITLLANGQTVASLQGSAHDVPVGRTVTVHLTSPDEFQPGPYTLHFQTDASYH
jgi:hypothetical protein